MRTARKKRASEYRWPSSAPGGGAKNIANRDHLSDSERSPNAFNWGQRVYAIAFDLDTEILQRHYPNSSWRNGYDDIRATLEGHGFTRQQGSVYFGDEKVDPVRCVLAIQDVGRSHAWFAAAVRDVRMLRIEENNDLMPALGDLELPLGKPGPAVG